MAEEIAVAIVDGPSHAELLIPLINRKNPGPLRFIGVDRIEARIIIDIDLEGHLIVSGTEADWRILGWLPEKPPAPLPKRKTEAMPHKIICLYNHDSRTGTMYVLSQQ